MPPSANIDIFNHHIGSIGAQSRRAGFVRGTGTEQ
jgi:hypothetical protein